MGEEEFTELADVKVAIYGGGKGKIIDSIQTHFGVELSSEADHTWVAPGAAKRAMRVTTSGVSEIGYADASGECTILAIIVSFFLLLIVLWQLIMFLIVILVLAIFSGGAALKYARATYMTAYADEIDSSCLESFTKDQIVSGRFVMASADSPSFILGPITKSSSKATRLFRYGIVWSVLIASAFLVFEVVYWFLYRSWLTDLMNPIIIGLGAAFLLGIILTDLGVLLRRRLRGGIEEGYVEGPLREET